MAVLALRRSPTIPQRTVGISGMSDGVRGVRSDLRVLLGKNTAAESACKERQPRGIECTMEKRVFLT